MQYWQEVFAGLQTRFRSAVVLGKGEICVSEFMFVPDARIAIGNKTYIVSSFFNNDAKFNVVDKIGRLIERDMASISEK